MKRKLYIILSILYFFSCSVNISANDFSDNRTKVLDVSLARVDYFEAEVILDIWVSENIGHANLGYDISEITGGYAPLRVNPGFNTLKLYIQRNRNKFSAIKTSQIEVHIYSREDTFLKETVPLQITWPGPEHADKILKSRTINKLEYAGVDKLNVNRNLSYSENLIENFLLNGFPIEKLNTFRPAYDFSKNNLTLSRFLDIDTIKNISRVFAISTNGTPLIKVKNSEVKVGEVYIGSGEHISGDNLIEAEELTSLKQKNLSVDSLSRILNFDVPNGSEIEDRMYKEAYNLIDTGYRENIYRAKAILDELLSLNSEYYRAYLELARFHMKTNWPAGVKKAEKLILIANDLEPEFADTHVLLGYVYTHQGKYSAANDEYILAEKLGTDNLWLYANWGLNYEMQGEKTKSINQYLMAIDKSSDVSRNQRPIYWILRNSKLFEFLISEGELKKADDLYSFSADKIHSEKCFLQQQAKLRLHYMQWYDGAIDSSIKAKKAGCKVNSPVLAVSYYMKWVHQLDNNFNRKQAESNLRRAEAAADSDGYLFFELSDSDQASKIIPKIIDLGKDIDHELDGGKTALLLAIESGDINRVSRLLTNGANVNKSTINNYYRPLTYAVYLKDFEMVSLLLSFGANANFYVEEGISLYDFSKEVGGEKISNMLSADLKT
ncbi:ankyrin repeat domain-containing protein [Microbulbifer sp. SSSA008]|uniref:ankyrin repeat domain-containing protein n=1 Tax=Microbulbifer sp. SSSA008 TaxID=3243380 RepID=UPI00403A285F